MEPPSPPAPITIGDLAALCDEYGLPTADNANEFICAFAYFMCFTHQEDALARKRRDTIVQLIPTLDPSVVNYLGPQLPHADEQAWVMLMSERALFWFCYLLGTPTARWFWQLVAETCEDAAGERDITLIIAIRLYEEIRTRHELAQNGIGEEFAIANGLCTAEADFVSMAWRVGKRGYRDEREYQQEQRLLAEMNRTTIKPGQRQKLSRSRWRTLRCFLIRQKTERQPAALKT